MGATYGVHQLHKREAAPEADADAAAAYYGGYYGHPGYYGYGRYGYAHHGYYGYPYARYGYRHFGKRSADAEPAVSYSHRSAQGVRGFYGFPYARYAPFAYHGLPYYG